MSLARATTVRQTPLIAIESPSSAVERRLDRAASRRRRRADDGSDLSDKPREQAPSRRRRATRPSRGRRTSSCARSPGTVVSQLGEQLSLTASRPPGCRLVRADLLDPARAARRSRAGGSASGSGTRRSGRRRAGNQGSWTYASRSTSAPTCRGAEPRERAGRRVAKRDKPSARAARHHRRHEQHQLVDEVGLEERGGERWPALEQQRLDALGRERAQLVFERARFGSSRSSPSGSGPREKTSRRGWPRGVSTSRASSRGPVGARCAAADRNRVDLRRAARARAGGSPRPSPSARPGTADATVERHRRPCR